MLTYDGTNQSLVGLEQGINLAVETPFVRSAIVGVLLNSLLPGDRIVSPIEGYGDKIRHPVIGQQRN